MNPDIQPFLQRYGIELAIEEVDENPMGPPNWQDDFCHYALWVTSAATIRGVPLYFSYSAEYGPDFMPVTNPETCRLVFWLLAQVLFAHEQGFDFFCDIEGLLADIAGAHIYYDAITAKLPDLRTLLGEAGLAELIQIGGRQ